LIDGIDRLLDLLQGFRRQEHGLYVADIDELNRLYGEVNRLALAGGFKAPPPLVQAGLVNWARRQPYPNREAGKEWERDLRSLQTEAREAQTDEEQGPGNGPSRALDNTCPPTPPKPAARRERKRRRTTPRGPTPLTGAQVEAVHLVGEHKGNVSAAAKAAGKSRQAMQKLYDKGLKKLGQAGAKGAAKMVQTLPADRRGQVDVADPNAHDPNAPEERD
jgi:hypothetical protein